MTGAVCTINSAYINVAGWSAKLAMCIAAECDWSSSLVAPVNEVRSGELRDEALPTSSQRNAPLCLSRLAEMGLLPALELNEQVNQIRIIIIIIV